MTEEAPPPRRGRTPRTDPDEICSQVSATKISSFECPAKWQFMYVDGLWAPSSPPQAFGKAFDDAVGAGFRHKIATGEDPDPGAVRDKFAESLVGRRNDDSVEGWTSAGFAEDLDEGVDHAGWWAVNTAPKVTPLDVQRRFSLKIQDWTVTGIVDLTMRLSDAPPELAGQVIVDHKVTSKSWAADKAAGQMQNVFYSLAARSGQLEPGTDHRRLTYEVMVRLKRGPKRQRFVVGVGQSQIDYLIQRIDTSRRLWRAALASGAFPPNREHWACSRRHCNFWRECERRHGGRVRD